MFIGIQSPQQFIMQFFILSFLDILSIVKIVDIRRKKPYTRIPLKALCPFMAVTKGRERANFKLENPYENFKRN